MDVFSLFLLPNLQEARKYFSLQMESHHPVESSFKTQRTANSSKCFKESESWKKMTPEFWSKEIQPTSPRQLRPSMQYREDTEAKINAHKLAVYRRVFYLNLFKMPCDREKEILHPYLLFPHGHKNQVWASPNPGSRMSIRVSHVSTWAITSDYPMSTCRELDGKQQQGHHWATQFPILTGSKPLFNTFHSFTLNLITLISN